MFPRGVWILVSQHVWKKCIENINSSHINPAGLYEDPIKILLYGEKMTHVDTKKFDSLIIFYCWEVLIPI